ncbi:MAG TPA: cupin domain-containing protein [Cellulomonas sp.]
MTELLPTSPDQPTSRGPAAWFTGDVWFDVLAAPPAPARLRVNTVRFAPGARTHWHVHSAGQSLHVTQGLARVGTRDGRVVEVRPGQTVWCPPGEWHWHGAGPDSFMEHLAMWEAAESDDGAGTTWGEAVDDVTYHRPDGDRA